MKDEVKEKKEDKVVEKEDKVEEPAEMSDAEKNIELTKVVKLYQEELEKTMFVIDPIKFNSTMHQGIQIILNKLESIEKRLNELKK